MRGKFWKGDILELDNLEASEVHAKERVTPKNGENFIFPVADGIWKSTSMRDPGLSQ